MGRPSSTSRSEKQSKVEACAGFRQKRDDLPWQLSLLLIGCLTLAAFALTANGVTDGAGGVPLDDAWIHFQFARNLACGDGFSFNPGFPTSGSTAPLWTVMLAGLYLAGGRFPFAGQVLSALCFLLTSAATYGVGKRLTGERWAGWLAGAIVAFNGRFVWAGLSALETCGFAALGLAAIALHLGDTAARRCRLRTAALFGLAALTRPEGYLLFALAVGDSFLRKRKLPWPSLVLFATMVAPYLIFSWRVSGHLLPNTYHAKASLSLLPDREALDFLSVAARYLILDNPLLLPFYVWGIGALARRATLLSLWSVGLPLVYAFLRATPYQHGRYLMPLIPAQALLAVCGLLEARRWAQRCRPDRVAAWFVPPRRIALLLLCVAGTAWRLPAMAASYAWNVDEINRMHVAIGRWVKMNTPPDALLALNDIGAIAYFSERPVLDLAGLVSPEVIPLLRTPDRDARLFELLAARDVDYVIIFPDWFPELAARRDVLTPVYQVTLSRRTIAGGALMVVYRAHW